MDARRAVLPSVAMTPIGLVAHLRWVEHGWFEAFVGGAPDRGPGQAAFTPPPDRTLAAELADYAAQCALSRGIVAGKDLDCEVSHPRLGTVSVRWVVVHMIEETGRHAGHLDVIREILDGVIGE